MLLMCYLPVRSFCWGGEGHKLIGNVAYHYLSNEVKDSIQFYLGSVSLADAGLWMDQMRKNPAYDYMKPWHYIDFNKGETYKPDTGQNVINELHKRIERLKHRNLYSKEQVALKYWFICAKICTNRCTLAILQIPAAMPCILHFRVNRPRSTGHGITILCCSNTLTSIPVWRCCQLSLNNSSCRKEKPTYCYG